MSDRTAWNSTLRPGKPLRAKKRLSRTRASLNRTGKLKRRGVMERHADDPDRYGELFLRVREMPCFGRSRLPLHQCGIGVRPATAHHVGRKDSEGLLPVCGRLHDALHERPWEIQSRMGKGGAEKVRRLALEYVEQARASS